MFGYYLMSITSFKDCRGWERCCLYMRYKVSYQLHNITSTHKAHDRDSEKSYSPSGTRKKYDTGFITSSLLQIRALIQVTLPHSLTSSQGPSEDQFPVKSPAPPLASAPVGILGSWPLPPPPGRCWYGCGFERLLVGQLEGIQRETRLFSDCYIHRILNTNYF